MKKEYVIWGIQPGGSYEVLLVEKYQGNYITGKALAQSLAKQCENFKCTGVRIQEIDFSVNPVELFAKAVNIR